MITMIYTMMLYTMKYIYGENFKFFPNSFKNFLTCNQHIISSLKNKFKSSFTYAINTNTHKLGKIRKSLQCKEHQIKNAIV